MGDSAFESWDVKGESSSKILTVRTHPEELHALKVWESSISKKPFLDNFRGAQFFGMSSYDKIFLWSKSMDLELSKSGSGMFLRPLVNFLEYEAYLTEIVNSGSIIGDYQFAV